MAILRSLLLKISYSEKKNSFEKNDCYEKGASQKMQLLKKKLLRKSNCCSELVTLKKFDKVLSPKNKTILKKSEHMGEGKPPFEKKHPKLD